MRNPELFDNETIDKYFEAALLNVTKLEKGIYFVYGSAAIAVREGNHYLARNKVRFTGIPPIRDIDIAFYSSVDWQNVVDLSHAVLIDSNGEICVDAHRINVKDGICSIKHVEIPLSWLTTTTVSYGSASIEILDPIPSLMFRLLHIAHDNLRPKDTFITLKEIQLLKNLSELRDERILVGFQTLLKHARPGKLLLTGPARVLLGFLPQGMLDKIRILYRKAFADNLIGEIPIRYKPEDM